MMCSQNDMSKTYEYKELVAKYDMGINLFDFISKSQDNTQELDNVGELISIFAPSATANETNLLSCLIHYIYFEGHNGEKNMFMLMELIETVAYFGALEKSFAESAFERLTEKTPNHISLKKFKQFLLENATPDEQIKTTRSLIAKIHPLFSTNEQLKVVLNGSDDRIENAIQTLSAYFVDNFKVDLLRNNAEYHNNIVKCNAALHEIWSLAKEVIEKGVEVEFITLLKWIKDDKKEWDKFSAETQALFDCVISYATSTNEKTKQ